jgi:hypothetical protein
MSKGVSMVPQRRQRGRRVIVPRRSNPVQRARNRKLHAMLKMDGKPKSGRCGEYVYYLRKGRQCWRRYVVPKDPRTPPQQRSRAAFGAASKTWSQSKRLTEKQRDAWYADGAKKQSRPRLGQSGPLTGQQNYIGRNCTRKQRDYEMLSHPPQREQEKAKKKGLRPELTAQVSQLQPVTRSTSGTRRAHPVSAPSQHRVSRGNARKTHSSLMSSQVARPQRLTRSTSDRPQTNTRALPVRCRSEKGHTRGTRKIGSLKGSPRLGEVRRNAHRRKLWRGS